MRIVWSAADSSPAAKIFFGENKTAPVASPVVFRKSRRDSINLSIRKFSSYSILKINIEQCSERGDVVGSVHVTTTRTFLPLSEWSSVSHNAASTNSL